MGDDQGEQAGVSGLCAKVVPVLCAHAQGSRFTEACGMRLRVIGMNSVTSAVNRCEAWAVDGMAGSGSTGQRVVISCTMSRVTRTGGALRAAASARPSFSHPGKRGDLTDFGLGLFGIGPGACLGNGGNIAFSSNQRSPRTRRGPVALHHVDHSA